MNKTRLEAFSDGVLAIIITIMVLDLKIPHSTEVSALKPVFPVFLSYVLSFVYLGIYWNNHHHMFTVVKEVNGKILWANLYLLFWLSLIPFTTAWMGENHFEAAPTALYGVILFMAAVAYSILQWTIIRSQKANALLKIAIGRDFKGKASIFLYFTAIFIAFYYEWVAQCIYVLVALMWLVPDRRIEKVTPSKH